MVRLGAEGFEAELLLGEDGRAKLNHGDEQGVVSLIERLALALGDEKRIVDRLNGALSGGASVLSVAAKADEADRVCNILEESQGHDMWRLGEWSQNRVGRQGSGEG